MAGLGPRSQRCHLPALAIWISDVTFITFLNLTSLVCRVGMIVATWCLRMCKDSFKHAESTDEHTVGAL